MALTLIWTGAIDGDFAKAGNWIDNATGTASATSPVATDTIIFDRGNVDLDTGLSPAIALAKMIGTNDYAGSIAPGSVFTTDCTDVQWAAGTINYSGSVTGFSKWALRNGTEANINGGTHANLVCVKSQVTVAAAAVVTNAFLDGGNVGILHNATDMTNCEIRGGAQVVSWRDGAFDVGRGSRLRAMEGCQLNSGTAVRENGTLIYLADESIADLLVEPNGSFDASQASRTFTLTLLNRWLDARVNLFTKDGVVTPGTENIYGIGGYSFEAGQPI